MEQWKKGANGISAFFWLDSISSLSKKIGKHQSSNCPCEHDDITTKFFHYIVLGNLSAISSRISFYFLVSTFLSNLYSCLDIERYDALERYFCTNFRACINIDVPFVYGA